MWNSELDAYTKTDRLAERPQNPIVVIGGRRVMLWKGLEDLLAPMPLLMRGLGDAIVDDLDFHYERLVGFYQPQTVVLFPSNSEFHVRDMKSAEGLVHAIQEFAQKDLFHRSTGRLYIIAPLNTRLFPGDRVKIKKATELLKAWAKSDNRIEILDANVFLCDGNGIAKADYFRADGVNLNDLGYTRLSMLLLSQIERDNPSIHGAL